MTLEKNSRWDLRKERNQKVTELRTFSSKHQILSLFQLRTQIEPILIWNANPGRATKADAGFERFVSNAW